MFKPGYIKRPLLLLLLVMGVVVSCNDKGIKGSFLTEELSWLVYDLGEHIQFVNDSDTTDQQTFTVVHRTDSTQIKKYYPIEAEVTLENDSSKDAITILLLKDQRSFSKYIRVGEVYRSLDLVTPRNGIAVGDANFDNVYVLNEPKPDEYTGNIITVYYSKVYGILKYITRDKKTYVQADPVALNFETGQVN